jgi:hypothetical protein
MLGGSACHGSFAREDAINIAGGIPELVDEIDAIAGEPATLDEETIEACDDETPGDNRAKAVMPRSNL